MFESGLSEAFLRGDYMPHGHCFLWQPGILWTTVLSDLSTGLAYVVISGALIFFVKQRQDLHFRPIIFLFGGFILWCGFTHLFSIYTIWHGAYGIHALIKAVTAFISLATTIYLIANFKLLKSIPNPEQLKSALQDAANKEAQRNTIVEQHKAQSIFKFAIELLPTGLLVVDENKRIVIANKALESMFGYAANELDGKPISVLLKDNQEAHHAILMQQYMDSPAQDHAMASGRVVKGRAKNGDDVAIEISLSVYEVEGTRHAFASVVDANKVSEQQHDFVETSNRLKRATDAASDGTWEWNIQTGEVWYSNTFLRMIGRRENPDKSSTQYSLQDWMNHIHPEDRETTQNNFKSHFSEKTMFDAIYRGLTAENKYEWMHARGNTRFDNFNNPILMSGTLNNINEKKLLEKKLSQKTHFLDAVLKKSLCGIYIFDFATKRNTYINDQYTAITGYDATTLENTSNASLLPLFHPDESEKIHQHLKEVTESDDPLGVSIDYRFRHRNGHWIWCYSRDSIYSRHKDGTPKEMIGTFFDISEIKFVERELEQSNLALERFAYSASHDLQEPLRKIVAFSDSLEQRLKGKLDQADAHYELERISNAASRMREMIDSLLQLSRYTRHKVNLSKLRFGKLLDIVRDDISNLITESKAQITLHTDDTILVDSSAFQQVLRNLIGNGIRYAKPDLAPEISITCLTQDGETMITIRDNGKGFLPENAKLIFEPFKRLAGKTVPGSGMGLAICDQIILAHNGSICANGEIDNGATFTIRLPYARNSD